MDKRVVMHDVCDLNSNLTKMKELNHTTSYVTHNNSITPPTHNTMISDAAASGPGHYLHINARHLLYDIRDTHVSTAPQVELPNGQIETASQEGYLYISGLPQAACRAYIFPGFADRSLLSIPTLCDYNCVATYTKHEVNIHLEGRLILTGRRNPITRLWEHELQVPSPQHSASHVVSHATNAELVRWYHGCFMSPAIPTFLAAVDKGFIRPPMLTPLMVRQNLPVAVATSQGHLNHLRQGLRSTKPPSTETETDTAPDTEEPSDTDNFPTTLHLPQHTLHAVTWSPQQRGRSHADMTGRFPVIASSGNSYYLIIFCEDANYIHVEPMASRSDTAYLNAYRHAFQLLRHQGACPTILRVDNEASATMIAEAQRQFGITVERAPPHQHRTLRAERAIQTFKNHFISGLCTTDPDFPLAAHDLLLPLALLTLNLMRASATNPSIPAWEDIHGPFDWNRYVLAPPGMALLIYEAPKTQRASWAPHGVPGYYLGPAVDHYRCHRVWATQTAATRITDTVAWHPRAFRLPGADPAAILTAAVDNLNIAIQAFGQSTHPQQQQLQVLIPSLQAQLTHLRDMYAIQPDAPQNVQRVEPQLTPVQRVDPGPTPGPTPAQTLDQTLAQTIAPTTATTTVTTATTATGTVTTQATAITAAPAATISGRRVPKPNPRYSLSSVVVFTKDDHACTRGAFGNRLKHKQTISALMSANVSQPQPTTYPTTKPITHKTPTYNTLRSGPDGDKWDSTHVEEFERLIETTGTCTFIPWHDKPAERNASYYNPICKVKTATDGTVTYRVRGTVADTHSDYEGPTSAYTANLPTVKILMNAVVSTPGSRVATADIKDYYLGTSMAIPEFMKVALRQIPDAIRARYHLDDIAHEGQVMMRIDKGMYGLVQAGRLAQERLVKHLAKHGYKEAKHTPMLFKHEHKKTVFTLVVDDFCIKYDARADLEHLFDSLRELYIITTDYSGSDYIGLSIKHDFEAKTITLSMPKYVQNALLRFRETDQPSRPTNSPMRYHGFSYGVLQEAVEEDVSPALDPAHVKRVQQIIGVFLYYARALDITFAYPLNKLATLPKNQHLEHLLEHFMDYAATWPNAQIIFRASNMQLATHSDASYLQESKARSRVGGFFNLGSYDPASGEKPNGFIDYTTAIIDVVVSSAMEAEIAGIFVNAQASIPLRNTLEDLGFPQDPTLIISDNLVGVNILNENTSPKKSKSIDMRYYWIRDRIRQKQFRLEWQPGVTNLADYLTKIHPVKHYQAVRSTFVRDAR